MVLVWLVAEIIGSGVAFYNIGRGLYNMYNDAGTIREYYKNLADYHEIQNQRPTPPLTESQVTRFENDFVIL